MKEKIRIKHNKNNNPSPNEIIRRRKISEKAKGRPTWNKGLTIKDDIRLKKISIATTRCKKGVPLTIEHRLKMSESHPKGDKCWNWKGGMESENKRIRQSVKFKLWRESVFKRDDWVCKKCKKRGGKLHPHHILNFSQYKDLRFVIDNGITLCEECHKIFHNNYGQINNNSEQINEFLTEVNKNKKYEKKYK